MSNYVEFLCAADRFCEVLHDGQVFSIHKVVDENVL